MRVDLKETQTALVFRADLPGLKKEEVKLVVEDGKILHLRAKQDTVGRRLLMGRRRRGIIGRGLESLLEKLSCLRRLTLRLSVQT